MKKGFGFKILIFIVLLGFFGAPNFVYGLDCTEDEHCPEGQVCEGGICIFEGNIGVTVTIGEEEEVPPWGATPVPPPPARAVFKGRVSPNAILTVLKHGKVASTFEAEPSGLFEKELTGLLEGTYNFGIWAEDIEGRRSVTLNFTIRLLWGTVTTISRIFIPPTISLSSTQVAKEDKIDILGRAFPGSQIYLFISPQGIVKETTVNSEGKWIYELDAASLEEGRYEVKAKAFFEDGEQSLFSQALSFSVGPLVPLPPVPIPPVPPAYIPADLNLDGKVNLIDFSILLFWWEVEKIDHPRVDINIDDKVDIVDFSIMMYYWTG